MRFSAVLLISIFAAAIAVAQQSDNSQALPIPGQGSTASVASPNSQPTGPPSSSNVAAPTSDKQLPSSSAATSGKENTPPQSPSSNELSPGTTVILPSSADPKSDIEARRDFDAGLKLKSSGKLESAFEKFESAAKLSPRNVEFVTAREYTRQELVMQAIQRGNKALDEKNEILAMASFRKALDYDPTNEFAQQQLRDSIPSEPRPSRSLLRVENSSEVRIQPNGERHDFHYRGDARTLLTQLAQAYGLTAILDDSVQQRRVHFDVEDVDFANAAELATRVTKTFWTPLSGKQLFFAADTAENRRSFERMSLNTFYVTNLVTPQELVELQNALRVLLDIRFIVQNPTEGTITIRAPQPILDAAAQLIDSINVGRPEVLLDVNIYQVSSSLLRQLGNNVTTQWTLYNLSPALLASLGAAANPNLINQLISSGGINQGNSQAIAALLAQLQQTTQNPILSQPLATFGGGITFFGLTLPGFTVNINLNESDVRILQHVTLRATQNTPTVMKIGERYPIVNATYAPIYNTTAISRVIGNSSYIAPFPSFTYEDLGLNLKATPTIHTDKDITLKLELQVRALTGQTVNTQPIISNREYSGTITMVNGESSVVAGEISKADSLSLMGYPFLSRVPGLGYGVSEHDKNVTDDELLVIITPHVIRLPETQTFAVQLPMGH